MSALADLKPDSHARLMDLLALAGADVSDWANFKGGAPKAASNPRYCYEWFFVAHGQFVALNLWMESMREDGSRVFQSLNYREHAANQRKLRKPLWAVRADRTDEAIQTAVRERLPIRVIVCDGQRRGIDLPGSAASQVKLRKLDPIPWSVTHYDDATGACVVERGAPTIRYVDQFSLGYREAEVTKVARQSTTYSRSGEIRRLVLQRAMGLCELCKQPGFVTAENEVFLETHHVDPLCENGKDSTDNVVALCPNDHRRAHHGLDRDEMRQRLKAYLAELVASDPNADMRVRLG